MSSQAVPIHRASNNPIPSSNNTKDDTSFDAFNFAPGQDKNIRWLSRPNQQIIQEKYSQDIEKFRITFDAENFQPEQIKIYIQNRKLTITGVYEEHSEGRHMQKQFEKAFDIPTNADVEAMASYITPNHMLVVEIPLSSNLQQQSAQVDHLNVNNNLNDQRRLSFSLNKFNTLNSQGLLSPANNLSTLPPPSGQSVRRTSITKTTTTTTSTGSAGLSPEATELLRSAETTTGSTQAYNTRTTERRASNTGNQQVTINEPNSSSSATTSGSILTNAELASLPIEIPPELLATGGTITIQKRKVSVTKTADPNTVHSISVPISNKSDAHSKLSTTTNINEPPGSKTIPTNNQPRMFSLEEFLQNKTWNPSIIDGTNGKKILYMRLPIKSGTPANQIKITLNGYDLRVEVGNNPSANIGGSTTEHSYRQVTLFPTCELEQLKTELKDDGFLHIKVPIKL